jgi:hypothetical protein
MSAHAFISYADVPASIIATSRQRVDSETQEKLISFDDCPLTGVIYTQANGSLDIEFPFPRVPEIRNSLVGWLMKWGISFQVTM